MTKKKKRIAKPVMNWQTGAYKSSQHIKLELPVQLLMICKLANITPEQLITDFIDNLSFGSWKRQGREKVRQLISEYFIEHGYGKELFSADQLRSLFQELDALGLLFPENGDDSLLDSYSVFREGYQAHWFNKWSAS